MSVLNNSTNQFIDIVNKTNVSSSNYADYYLVNQGGNLENSTLGQMYDISLSQGTTPPTYTTTQSISAPIANLQIVNSAIPINITLPKLNGFARYGQPFTVSNTGTATVTYKNNAGTTLFTIGQGQIVRAFISFIDLTSGGADLVDHYQMPISNLSTANGLVYYPGSNISTISTTSVDGGGAINNSGQPLVIAYVSSNIGSATGDGTNFPVIFDTVVRNNRSGYNALTGVFTAPVAGNYLVCGQITFSNVNAADTSAILNVGFTSRTYQVGACNPFNCKDANNNLGIYYQMINNMAASDQLIVGAQVSGGGKNVGINGSGNPLSYITICLLS